MRLKKILSTILVISMVLCSCCISFAQDDSTITIICTNDVHCAYTEYDKIATLAKDADLLIDNGDAIQGALVGTLSQGDYIIDIMNFLHYDLAGLGNHEFDFGFERLHYLTEKADYPYICCNLRSIETGETVFDPYKIFDIKGKKIAIIAADTPHSLVSANPKFFKDGNGNYIYDFSQQNDGVELVNTIQEYVDEVRDEGADVVILLSHLGIFDAGYDVVWSSSDVLMRTEGIDVVLDGHSHTVNELTLPNKNGENVPLYQAGTGLSLCTKVEIDGDDISCSLVDLSNVERDPLTTDFISTISEKFESLQKEKVAVALQPLSLYDENGVRLVRNKETAIGNFCADALCWKTGADIGLVNGGGIRATIEKGDVTLGDLINVHSFANTVVTAKLTGQMIADTLEQAASSLPSENGGFLHVSGMTWSVDVDIPSPVITDDSGAMVKIEGKRRVHDIKIAGEPLDLQKKYTVAGSEFVVLSGGNGLQPVPEEDIIDPNCGIDYEILVEYARDGLSGIIGEKYAQIEGRLRFEAAEESFAEANVTNDSVSTTETASSAPVAPSVYTVRKGDCLWNIARIQLGNSSEWMTIYQLNKDIIRDPKLIYPGQELKLAK